MRLFLLSLAVSVAVACAPDPGTVTQAQLGEAWPLTVSSAALACVGGQFVIAVAGGETYALNGSAKTYAKTRRMDWKDIEPIWKKNPDLPSLRVDISPLIERGLALCKS